jgi:hypothetical protein
MQLAQQQRAFRAAVPARVREFDRKAIYSVIALVTDILLSSCRSCTCAAEGAVCQGEP